MEGRAKGKVCFGGRILYLTADTALVARQLGGDGKPGTDLAWDPERALMDNISTDEITPAWACFYYDQTLATYVYAGMRDKCVRPGEVKAGGFEVVVSGLSKGCGSSRETAPYAEKWAGIRLVIARTIEKIYGQNCQNIGLLTSTDFGLVPRILAGEEIPSTEFTKGLDAISKAIVEAGGLFEYNKLRLSGKVRPHPTRTGARPMTMVEKIIARHAVIGGTDEALGVPYVQPGDALFVRADVRFSHEYVTPMAEALFKEGLGATARIEEPQSVYAFRDHLTFLGDVMKEEHRKMGLLERAQDLARTQGLFAERQGIRLYGEVPEGGSEAICHTAMLEDIALPGQVVVGTDSHTCTAGAVGCFSFGVGSTDMANAWYTRDVRLTVPETVLFVLSGTKRWDVAAKDVMLGVLGTDYCKEGKAIGKVLEFGGDGARALSMDERATLTNMAVECGATTGIIQADETTVAWINGMRPGVDPGRIRAGFVSPDPGCRYAAVFEIDLAKVVPMVATPGDPRNAVPIDSLGGDVRDNIAYAGSCTASKMEDMDMYARVLKAALEQGKRVHPGVEFYLQFGSQKVKRYAERMGYFDIFERAGARLLNPSCGACINAGPGASRTEDDVTVSAINRNFPGRSGPGKVYLASPYVVAASAIAGRIVPPSEILAEPVEAAAG
ncbi:MAG: 3-isopropylmalate dehydratase [Planctomycetes bacterium]|nr:3-isopropylmalate dehydratase [Planctomycetota bacterium]